MASTNILQWNCEGIKPKFATGDIHQLIKETGTNCICLQETKLLPNAHFEIRGFKSYLQNLDIDEGQSAHGGVAIFVKKFVSSYKIELQTTLQAVAVSIKIHKRITVCSLYLPPGEVIEREQLQNLLEQLPKPFVILGDMNAHHPMWYDTRPVNERGDIIVDFITENDIALLDKNKMTSIWKVDKTFSHIDLSICSTELLTRFHWDVYEEPLNSDHFPILIKSETIRNQGSSERWLTEKANWEKYRKSTEVNKSIEEFNSLGEATAFFENHIKEAASDSIPKTRGTFKRRSPPWWNKKCRTTIWKRKAAFRRYSRVSSRENYNKFSKARAEAKQTVKKSKKESWETFVNSINHKSTSKEVWRKINMLNNRYKSDAVNTLFLNKKLVKISNVPASCKARLIKELSELGCIQTINTEDQPQGTSILVRFESDMVTEKALNLDGSDIQGMKLKVELIPLDNNLEGTQPVVLDEPKEIANCLGRRFSFISSESSSDPRFKEHKERTERTKLDFSTNKQEGYNSPITSQELEYALNLAKDSSPGPDEVCYSMLKNLAPSGKRLLLALLNRIFKEGTFPERWKEAYVIPILKEGKQPTNPGSYRPIALTSCICKLLERIVNRRLVWFLEYNGLIDKYQSGFRKGRSTLDCLAALATEAHDSYRRKLYLFCIFFDLEKAYDTCWKHLIMNQLHKFGLRGELPKLIEDFLTNRKFRVKVRGSLSELFTQEMGVPQGGVLSCTLFSIAINTVVEVIKGLATYSLYVDDKRIAYAHSDPKICETRLQRVLDALHRWSLETGFRFSLDKTEWMVFHRTRRPLVPGYIQFTLDGKVLKEVDSKKFLGLTFDRALTFKNQVDNLRGRAIKALNIIQVISRANKDTDTKVLLRIYKALVRSKIDYGCQVYGTAPKSYLKPLDPVHHKGLRLCLGAYRTSPFESLYVETNEPSLTYRRQMLQLQYYARLKQFLPDRVPVRLDDKSLDGEYARPSNKPISLGYTVRQLESSLNINFPNTALLIENDKGPWDQPKPIICMDLASYTKSTTSAEEYAQHFLEHKHNTDVDLYTDGSKSTAGVGAGVAIMSSPTRYNGIRRRLHETASIFTAELYAIKLALTSLKTSQALSCTVYTDSRSAVQAIQRPSSCKLVSEILELIVILSNREISVVFCWLPGHSDIKGNELADKEAKLAVGLHVIRTQEIPVSDTKAYIKRKIYEKWRKEWENVTIQKFKLKEICPIIRRTPVDIGLSRIDSWKLTRLRIGHTRWTHSYHFSGEDMPWCIECDVPLTVKHQLTECSNGARERLEYYNPREVSLEKLLSEKNYALKALEFLKEIHVYHKL